MRGAAVAALLAFASAAAAAAVEPVPQPDLDGVEPAVRTQLTSAHAAIVALAGGGSGRSAKPDQLARAYGELGRLYASYDLDEAAETAFANACDLAPEAVRWRYLLGYVEARRGQAARAVASFARVVEVAPRDLPAWLRLGEARLDLGQAAEAREAFTTALDLAAGAEAAAVHWGLGRAAQAMGDFPAAARHFEAALALQPEASRLHLPLALAYRRLGRDDEARREIARRGEVAVRFSDPEVGGLSKVAAGAGVHNLEGDRAMLEGRYADAVAAYREAVAAQPGSFFYRRSLGVALYTAGRPEAAAAVFEKALTLDPGGGPSEAAREKADLEYGLGGLYVNRRDDTRAERHLRRAVELDPKRAAAHLELGNLLGRTGRLEAAVEEFTAVLLLEPDNARARLQRATTLMDLGRFAEAVPELERFLREAPSDARAQQLLATARARSGRR